MDGLDRLTFQPISGWERCAQAIETILFTRLNTRVMRPWFGSDVPNIIDRPINEATVMDFIMAVAEPLAQFEPEFELRFVDVQTANSGGNLGLELVGVYLPENKKVNLVIHF